MNSPSQRGRAARIKLCGACFSLSLVGSLWAGVVVVVVVITNPSRSLYASLGDVAGGGGGARASDGVVARHRLCEAQEAPQSNTTARCPRERSSIWTRVLYRVCLYVERLLVGSIARSHARRMHWYISNIVGFCTCVCCSVCFSIIIAASRAVCCGC